MINIKKISKFYGKHQVLREVSVEIQKGEIVGFLGQNGAGKTTLMRILTGYLPASSGSAVLRGMDINKNALAVRRHIGYLPEVPPLYPQMTVGEYLKFAARLKDVPNKKVGFQLTKVLHECSLINVKDKMIAHLSLGYKQRVGIAQAIIHDPEILILDEPTKGLDPIQVRQVRLLIKNLEEKRTVILSTHILSEIEQMAQRVLMIKEGRIIADEPLENLLARHDNSLEKAFFMLNRVEDPA